MTLGGYVESDISGEIEWYSAEDPTNAVAPYDTWMLPVTTMEVSGLSLLTPPVVTPTAVEVDPSIERLVNAVDPFPVYAHFNTGYPFIGVD